MFHNCVTGAILLRRFQKTTPILHFGDLHRHFAWQAQHFRRVVLHAHFGNLNVRAASSGDNLQIPWQAWHFVTCDEI